MAGLDLWQVFAALGTPDNNDYHYDEIGLTGNVAISTLCDTLLFQRTVWLGMAAGTSAVP